MGFKNTGVGCHSFLQGIFPTQESNSGLPHCRQIPYHLSHQGSPYIMPNARLHKPQVWTRLPGEISTTLSMQMIPLWWQKVKITEEPLDEGERGEWKSWSKTQHSKHEDHDIQSHHFMANRWENNGKSGTMEIFSWAPKSLRTVIAATKLKDACSLEEKL